MTFDDGYDRGDVVRLFFGHSPDGNAFARKDVVVVADDGDAIVGNEATVSDKTRGSLQNDAEDPGPLHDVRVRNRELTIRKAAVVIKRHFGTVDDDDVNLRDDPTGNWSPGDGPPPHAGPGE